MIQYKVVRCRMAELERALNEVTVEDWRLHSVLDWNETEYNIVFYRDLVRLEDVIVEEKTPVYLKETE